jgi:hypothetical protein
MSQKRDMGHPALLFPLRSGLCALRGRGVSNASWWCFATIELMEPIITARRTEDIALDLLKFIASTANVTRASGSSTGFAAPSSAKPEDQVTHLLELYARCKQAVETK